ncbi:MAG: ethanolamine ammonia-lyase subunit EutC [Oscillospiraceae bacterium]|nr:ethanolamine ammonia-lyase subunit EutC [Oscillospiraceae bacterium]
MLEQSLIEQIVSQVVAELGRGAPAPSPKGPAPAIPAAPAPSAPSMAPAGDFALADITSPEQKAIPLLEHPADYDALIRMKSRTPARIGVGRAGPRLNTKTLLTLRADHAAARDAVFLDVDEKRMEALGLFTVSTKCADKNEFVTRPDLGRDFSEEALELIRSRCQKSPQVQIIVCDGLSSTAVSTNAPDLLPVLLEGLKAKGIQTGTPFFVKNARVAAQDRIAETLGATVVCSLIGERPGLATAESMSAYISFEAKVGMPEARRTVVSNIHKEGIPAVEAGAYIADLIETVLKARASGVDLKK